MPHPYFELNDVDRRFFAERIDPLLPRRIFDAHRHIGLKEQQRPMSQERWLKSWPSQVADHESFGDAHEGYRLLFPGREVEYLAFGWPLRECDSDANNDYLIEGLQQTGGAGLALTRPDWSPDKVAELLRRPGIIGIKSYSDLIPGNESEEVSIFDFYPHEQLRELDRVGGLLMLHIPRAERLASPENAAEVTELRHRYPDLTIVIAHVGRAYAGRFAREGLRRFEQIKGLLYDTSALLNPSVHALALDRLGPDRLMFGSDFPILYMRGRRRWEGDRYINLTSGNYAWNTDRQPPEVEATYTLFIYEAIAACLDAIMQLGFGPQEIEAVFDGNARATMERLLAAKERW